jgi:hypothetical protein
MTLVFGNRPSRLLEVPVVSANITVAIFAGGAERDEPKSRSDHVAE